MAVASASNVDIGEDLTIDHLFGVAGKVALITVRAARWLDGQDGQHFSETSGFCYASRLGTVINRAEELE